ncbi:MAG: quinone-dependent dihydroorotate dehydrogenase [Ginsengibacter sp.]
MYKMLRSILFWFDAEQVHYFSMNIFNALCKISILKRFFASQFDPGQSYAKTVLGLHFKNPVGLGAGFDKNAKYLTALHCMGFGFVEIGTVTPIAQEGNPKPRLFRLPKDKALINRMGFNNDGASAISMRLKEWRLKNPGSLIIGGNIGKNKHTSNEDAWKDYEISFNTLFDQVDYFVVNVSSPNTPGLRALQQDDFLYRILNNLQQINAGKSQPKPILLKIAPDLTTDELNNIIQLIKRINLDGIIAANTTVSRAHLLTASAKVNAIGMGGLSGRPLQQISTQMIKTIHEQLPQLTIIGSGGIGSAADADEKFYAGADLVQVWTGFIYEGPAVVKKILKASQTATKNYRFRT